MSERCQRGERPVTWRADAPWGNWQPEGFWSPKFRFESWRGSEQIAEGHPFGRRDQERSEHE